MPTAASAWVLTGGAWKRKGRADRTPGVAPVAAHDWSETNLPWAYEDTSVFTEEWPANVTVVDIQTASTDFYTNLQNTLSAAGGARVVVRLGEGVYRLKSFRMAGSSGLSTYAFGIFFPSLRGFLGQGPDKTIVQMDANSLTTQQAADLAAMPEWSNLGLSLARFDGSAASPVLIAGVTFRAADQQKISAFHSTLDKHNVAGGQPAPHYGVTLYAETHAVVSYVRFQAPGRAVTSLPPFECSGSGSQYGQVLWNNCEWDGRRAPELDPARPRRCGTYMGNNEAYSELRDCWLHHSNISRYAVNDENRDTQGQYVLTRTKLEQITNTQNTDPALNGGVSLGGYTNASLAGWESCNGTITLNDCIFSQDNNQSSGQVPMHLQLTSVGTRSPQGGRLYVNGGQFLNTGWAHLSEYIGFRIQQSTYWALDGYANTLFVYHRNGQRLASYTVSGAWPPSAASLAAAGVTPSTHYLVRSA